MDIDKTRAFIDQLWDESVVPTLTDYIRIPNKSPLFDPRWQEHGHMDRAVALLADWCRRQPIQGLSLEVVRLEGRTPLIFMEIPGRGEGCALLYGHLDKQPEMSGWAPDLGPWTPLLRDDRLYGRGGADDGYAVFAALTAIRALQAQDLPHARCVVLIEACEESGSYDLPHYIDALAGRIGAPDLVVCLDSGCGNYDQLWCTTSLRGMVSGNLFVEILSEGVHSGDAGGVVADSFRILRLLLSRLEDEESGVIRPRELYADIPPQRREQAQQAAQVLGATVYGKFPFVEGARPVVTNPVELILNRTWRPALAVTGAAGLPALADAGNVCRPLTGVRLSLRLPPTTDGERATQAVKALLEKDPPYGARVRFAAEKSASGWNAPPLAPWLEEATDAASRAWFGNPAMYMGEGGTIPFMDLLGKSFPQAQFLVTGVLGPHSNAHGPNEFLHLPTARNVTGGVAQVLAAHAWQGGRP
ncbi:MAG: M20 family metallopeptidase [Pseudomonadota bacterium]|nr:M20 family metallopeptidase [Pseudomonadota bacterium]